MNVKLLKVWLPKEVRKAEDISVYSLCSARMTSRLLQLSQKTYGFSNLSPCRNVIRLLGQPPEEARSLKKKIEGCYPAIISLMLSSLQKLYIT
jgi:hypothetical protein